MRALWVLLAASALGGCALFHPADPVNVSVVGIDPLPGQDLEVRMAVHLRLQNPNDAAIDYDGVALNLDVNGQPLASGVSDQHGEVARYSEVLLTVPVSVSALSVLRQAVGWVQPNPTFKVPYTLRGKLGRGPWAAARFEAHGSLDLSPWGAAY